jgi:hypothetical protein
MRLASTRAKAIEAWIKDHPETKSDYEKVDVELSGEISTAMHGACRLASSPSTSGTGDSPPSSWPKSASSSGSSMRRDERRAAGIEDWREPDEECHGLSYHRR